MDIKARSWHDSYERRSLAGERASRVRVDDAVARGVWGSGTPRHISSVGISVGAARQPRLLLVTSRSRVDGFPATVPTTCASWDEL